MHDRKQTCGNFVKKIYFQAIVVRSDNSSISVELSDKRHLIFI